MKIKESIGSKVFDAVNIVFLALLMFVTIFPVWHVLMCSFSDSYELLGHSGALWLPLKFNLRGYAAVFTNASVWNGLGITVFVVVLGTFLNIVFTVITAYFLTKSEAMLSSVLAYVLVFSMYFSTGLIPGYLVVKYVGLYNNVLALIIPTLINTFNVIIMRTAVAGVPASLFESAELDGASHFTIVSKLVVPLCLPTVAMLVLYYSVGHWNSWFRSV